RPEIFVPRTPAAFLEDAPVEIDPPPCRVHELVGMARTDQALREFEARHPALPPQQRHRRRRLLEPHEDIQVADRPSAVVAVREWDQRRALEQQRVDARLREPAYEVAEDVKEDAIPRPRHPMGRLETPEQRISNARAAQILEELGNQALRALIEVLGIGDDLPFLP